MRRDDGYSLIEMTVAMAIMMAVTASVFTMMNPAQGNFVAQPETADMQQRLRVATDALYKDLVMAGGGAYQGSLSGSLAYMFAPVLPYRSGSANDDPPGTFKTDTISIIYVPDTNAQTTLATNGPSLKSAEIGVNPEPGCPGGKANQLCGFEDGMTLLMYDDSGNYDTFSVTNVQDQALHIQHNSDTLTYTGYNPSTTKIVQVRNAVYYLKTDNTNGVYQLMFYDGGLGPDVPIADHVVGLNFDYYGDPQPPQLLHPGVDQSVSYGPKPPALGSKATGTTSFGNGENCTFQAVGGVQTSKLADLTGGNPPALVKLTAAQLTDGPWCPDPANPNRWDADLLRIRKIAVSLRVQAALAALRGPTSVLFTHGGTSRGGSKYIPDQEMRFQVTPRNLNLGR